MDSGAYAELQAQMLVKILKDQTGAGYNSSHNSIHASSTGSRGEKSPVAMPGSETASSYSGTEYATQPTGHHYPSGLGNGENFYQMHETAHDNKSHQQLEVTPIGDPDSDQAHQDIPIPAPGPGHSYSYSAPYASVLQLDGHEASEPQSRSAPQRHCKPYTDMQAVLAPTNPHGMSEPYGYGPRTAVVQQQVPPPPPLSFDLPLVHREPQASVGQDAFYPGQNMAVMQQQQHTPVPVPVSSMSSKLRGLLETPTGLPSFEVAMHQDNFPFVESCRQFKTINHGVIRIRNIPFSTSRAEIIAFLGRNSKMLNDVDEPVHIIMERITSKTMDAYVEFCTLEDAMKAVEKHVFHVNSGRAGRLGDRNVDVELSSQARLMHDLFPLATGVVWDGAAPQFKPHDGQYPWNNFKGFISEEEMIMLVKHVKVPHRSPFSKECPQRPYECLISTLKKFPWSFSDKITISQRRALFKATCDLSRLLLRSISRGDDAVYLNARLHHRLAGTAMSCPGFTPLMKDDLAWLLNLDSAGVCLYGQPFSAHGWRHQYGLAAKPGIPLDVIEWYICIIREQTYRDMMHRPVQERNGMVERSSDTDMHWGFFWAEVGYVSIMGVKFDRMTLAQAANAEFCAVERILQRALASNNNNVI
ncbi:hypothetical protein GMORB2_3555 [Geosmithia morbida]|uniref:RRM domain-containing protein n=1 Tax=Geosmithia morbida TaxID=1094350 RepID=A0A9P5CYX8_9HYPO|nr:uncharacterized protein GMORB2_3555 [Geosmithia morbida]KAF4119867.1 hypothetical protein GMORB2_3555 [Geosmithia morbida]